jgi:hypothetical protein
MMMMKKKSKLPDVNDTSMMPTWFGTPAWHGLSIHDIATKADLIRAPDLVPDLSPKYMGTVGTRWYLLGLAAAPLYQRVPTVTNSHKHNQDSNSLGGTKNFNRPVA